MSSLRLEAADKLWGEWTNEWTEWTNGPMNGPMNGTSGPNECVDWRTLMLGRFQVGQEGVRRVRQRPEQAARARAATPSVSSLAHTIELDDMYE